MGIASNHYSVHDIEQLDMRNRIKMLYIIYDSPNKLLMKLGELLGREGIQVDFYVAPEELKTFNFNKCDYDVVYYTNHYSPLRDLRQVYSLKRTCGKMVLGVHAPPTQRFIFKPHRPKHYLHSLFSIIRTISEKRAFSAVHTLNSFDTRLYEILGYRNVHFIPWGLDIDLIRPYIRSKDTLFTIILSYATRYDKGGDIALKALYYLLSKDFNLRIIIILGRGYRYELASKFLQLRDKFPNKIDIYEWLPQEKFFEILSRSHVLLFPSRIETFGLTVLEALALGTPVVAFDIPGAPHDILLNMVLRGKFVGYIARPFSYHDLIKGVLLFYKIYHEKPEIYDKISQTAIDVAQSFTLKHMARKISSLISRIVTG